MELFKKKRIDFIDLTKLERQGILQKSKEIARKQASYNNENKLIDLSGKSDNISPDNSDNLNFLTDLAKVGERDNINSKDNNAKQLKLKIEDIEYKLDKFVERLNKIEEKLVKFGKEN